MKPENIATAKNPDLRASLEAMQRAAREARQKAIDTNTGIVVGRNGRPVRISAAQLRQRDGQA